MRRFGPIGDVGLRAVPVAVASAFVFTLLAAKDGGFATTVWLPSALFLTALLAIVLVTGPVRLRRVELLALGALAAFTVWSAVSLLWAGDRGTAWDGANRTLFYLVLFALFLAVPWRPLVGEICVGAWSVGVVLVGSVQFLRVAGHPAAHADFFVTGRLATPISYSNADCALFVMAAFPAIVIASRRRTPILLRGVLLAASGVAFDLALACQSRTSLVAVPVTALAGIAVARQRVRVLVAALPVGVAVALAARRMLDLYHALAVVPPKQPLVDARWALVVTAGGLFVVGCALALLDRKLAPPPRVVRATGLVSLAGLAVALAAGVAALVVAFPHPVSSFHAHWKSFTQGSGYTDQRKSHLTSGGTHRYDFWRVAFDEFKAEPVVGVGVDNFAADYLRHRRSLETPLYPHSVLLRALSETGVIGGLLFVAFLGVLGAALRDRGVGPEAGTAAVLPFAYWLVHGSVDWLWEIPALGAPALAFAAMAVRLTPRDEPALTPLRLPGAAVAVVAAAAIASFGFPWVAAQETAVAASGWPADKSLAIRRLRLAANLNPLSDVPPVTAGLIEARSGNPAAARGHFADAIGRNGANWFSHLELAVVDAQLRRHAEAVAESARARELNPRSAVVVAVARRLDAGAPVTQRSVDVLVAGP